MNKRQELEMMVLRAQIRSQKRLAEMMVSWLGQEAVEAGAPKPYQERNEPAIVEEKNATRAILPTR